MAALSEGETIGLAFTLLDYFHSVDRLAVGRASKRVRNQMIAEWSAKGWGGIFGETPRATDEERYFEAIAPQWAQAMQNHPELAATPAAQER